MGAMGKDAVIAPSAPSGLTRDGKRKVRLCNTLKLDERVDSCQPHRPMTNC